MLKKLMTCAMLAVSVSGASAQAPVTLPEQSVMDSMTEAARERARSASAQADPSAPKASLPHIDMDRARSLGGVDPLEIAKKYQQQRQADSVSPETLYVFVSASLKPETLKKLALQTKAAKGIMVLRGIKGGFAGYKQMVKDFEPIIATGADIQIHPELFDRFNVSAVPAFVIAQAEEGCVGNACNGEAISVAGDVSLTYALDHLTTRPHPLAKVAQRYRSALP